MKKNKTLKRGQVGTTLTWIIAFVIICFIMGLFISGTVVVSKNKALPWEKNKISLADERNPDKKEFVDISLQRKMEFFLSSYVEFEGKKMSVAELIALETKDNKKKYELLQKACKRFVEEDVFNEKGSGIYALTIKIYDTNYYNGWVSLYSTPLECSPFSGFYTEFQIPENKKISLCVRYIK